MKQQLRTLFSPLLSRFESGDEEFSYKPSYRITLFVLSTLFIGLASVVFFLGQGEDMTYLLPVFLFGGTGIVGLIIGFLGNDRAVAKIWGSKR